VQSEISQKNLLIKIISLPICNQLILMVFGEESLKFITKEIWDLGIELDKS